MRRREFIACLGGAAVTWPFAARAQPPAPPTIGFLGYWASPKQIGGNLVAFRQGLAVAGFVEGQSVTIEYRWANFQFDRLKALAEELVRYPVPVIVALLPQGRRRRGGNQGPQGRAAILAAVFAVPQSD